MTHNPISEIKRPKNPKPRDRRISDHEIERVLLACQYEVGQVPENRTQLVGCLFLLALETAMRLGELCAIRSDDIFLAERYVVLRDTKNNDRRHVPLSKKAVQLFTVIKALDFHVAPLVASSLFRKVCKRAEIEGLRFHDTRHEALTQLARKIDVLDLARMVGHRDTRSLMIYYNATATEIASRLG